jgi:hypothetical protein
VGDDRLAGGGGGDQGQVRGAAEGQAVGGEVENDAAGGGELQGGDQVLVAAGAGSPGEQGEGVADGDLAGQPQDVGPLDDQVEGEGAELAAVVQVDVEPAAVPVRDGEDRV